MLDKAIKYKKEYRKPYCGIQRYDRSCRHGGSCTYCSGGRQFSSLRRLPGDDQVNLNHVDSSDDDSNHFEYLCSQAGFEDSWNYYEYLSNSDIHYTSSA